MDVSGNFRYDYHFRELTKTEVILNGLSSGCDASLEVRQEGIAGRGVFATADIPKGSWLCEYKTTRVFNIKEKEEVVKEYEENGEGSYIVESLYTVENGGHLCFDATRKYHQFGRYMNHALQPNACLTAPFMVRGKWRIGFVSVREINAGDEVVWDYKVKGEDCSGCMLECGVIKPSKRQVVVSDEDEVTVTHPLNRPRRRLCYCPIEGCNSKPLTKLSNHLSQVHHLNPQQRIFASGKEGANRVKKTVNLRRSQRTLPFLIGSYQDHTDESKSESENPSSSCRESRDETTNTPATDDSAGPSGFSCLEIVDSDGQDSANAVNVQEEAVPGIESMCTEPPTSARQPSFCGRTEAAGRFPLSEPFLSGFTEYLSSRIGGKKKPKAAEEICTDISKYLWFAKSDVLDDSLLFSRAKIRQYVSSLEEGGIGPSGLLTKLRRISMAIKFTELSVESTEA